MAFNPVKDAELCSVSSDGVAKFWDVRTKACFNEVKGIGEAVSLAWAPDGQTLLVGNRDSRVSILAPGQSTALASRPQPMPTQQLSFCWGGQKIFAAVSEGRARILTYPDWEPVLRLPAGGPGTEASEFMLRGHTSSCLTVELQPTARYLATGGSDSIIALWDTTDWICQRTISGLAGPVRSLSMGKTPTPTPKEMLILSSSLSACLSLFRRGAIVRPLTSALVLFVPPLLQVLPLTAAILWGGATKVRGGPGQCLFSFFLQSPTLLSRGAVRVGQLTGRLMRRAGSGLEVYHVETGEHVHTFKTASSCPVVAWAPTRYCLAYGDLGVLRIVGVDMDRK